MVVRAHSIERGTTRLALQGELTVVAAAQLRQRLIEAVGSSSALTLDLSAVEEIDLACLQLLFATRRSAQNGDKTFRLVGVDNPAVAQAVRTNGFTLPEC